jgi:uncharacterized membrane protein
MLLLASVFTAVGALFIGLAIPLMRRRVPPNALYGLRVPATFADEWVWYEANAQSGRDLFVLGWIELVYAVLLPLLPHMTAEKYALANVAYMLVGMLGFAVIGWRRANRLLRERKSQAV